MLRECRWKLFSIQAVSEIKASPAPLEMTSRCSGEASRWGERVDSAAAASSQRSLRTRGFVFQGYLFGENQNWNFHGPFLKKV